MTAFKLTSPINTMKEDAHLAGDKTEALSDQATGARLDRISRGIRILFQMTNFKTCFSTMLSSPYKV